MRGVRRARTRAAHAFRGSTTAFAPESTRHNPSARRPAGDVPTMTFESFFDSVQRKVDVVRARHPMSDKTLLG